MPGPAPRIVYNDDFVKTVLKSVTGLIFVTWTSLRIGLWTNDRPLDRTLTAGSFVPPSFAGYGILPINWNPAGPTLDISDLWGMDAFTMTWTVASIGSPETIFGWYAGFLAGPGPEAFFAKFDNPTLLTTAGQQVSVSFRSRLSTAFNGPNT